MMNISDWWLAQNQKMDARGTLDGGRRHRQKVLIIVENLPVPFDRRVWNEATTLADAGYEVSVICPIGRGAEARYEVVGNIHIYRHPLPFEARGILSYFLEYGTALFWEFVLACRIYRQRGFDVIHACNPPDLIFLVGAFFKLFFKTKFVFDHHDINPELFDAKFGKENFLYRIVTTLERWSFASADISIATNNSYRKIAIERGGMDPDCVFVVRSGPNLDRLKIAPSKPELKKGREYCVGYVGVMGAQEGLQYLLKAARHIVHDLRRTDVQFCLVGDGPESAILKDLARELAISEYVTFMGTVSDQELLDVLNTADVCVNSDECNAMNDKSTMNKIMEYMALAKPIVQFDLSEGRFSAQGASLYARHNDPNDFADKILELLADKDQRQWRGEFGRRRVIDHLAWPHEAPKLLRAYEFLFQTEAETNREGQAVGRRYDN